MISIANFRANLYAAFKLSKLNAVTFEVTHGKVVYDVTIEPTFKPYKQTRRKRRTIKNRVEVEYKPCELCKSLKVSGICLNTKCDNGKIEKTAD